MSTDDPADYGALFAAHEKSLSPDERARDESRRAVDAAILRMARASGAPVRERPIRPGYTLTTDDTEPVTGIGFALMLQDAARRKIHDYIKRARQDGVAWQQIGEALRLERVAEERGVSLAEVAFDYATDAEHAGPFDRLSFAWTCPSCRGLVIDYGPSGGHPVDCESGHAEGCERLAAAVAAYEAEWADEG